MVLCFLFLCSTVFSLTCLLLCFSISCIFYFPFLQVFCFPFHRLSVIVLVSSDSLLGHFVFSVLVLLVSCFFLFLMSSVFSFSGLPFSLSLFSVFSFFHMSSVFSFSGLLFFCLYYLFAFLLFSFFSFSCHLFLFLWSSAFFSLGHPFLSSILLSFLRSFVFSFFSLLFSLSLVFCFLFFRSFIFFFSSLLLSCLMSSVVFFFSLLFSLSLVFCFLSLCSSVFSSSLAFPFRFSDHPFSLSKAICFLNPKSTICSFFSSSVVAFFGFLFLFISSSVFLVLAFCFPFSGLLFSFLSLHISLT